ncbi:hypothetical protein QW131_28440 [Roseibium salinum]|nr:hypothetical protein [Roseibium salinum]
MSDASHYPCLVWYDDGTFQFEPAKPVAPMAGNRRVLGTFSLFLVYLNDAARATAEGSTRIERNHWLFRPHAALLARLCEHRRCGFLHQHAGAGLAAVHHERL